jgi:hypothetical protein
MNCPKCNNPMHKSSIGLLVCPKCGYTLQPGETASYQTDLPPEQQNAYNAISYNPNPQPYTPSPLESYLGSISGPSSESAFGAMLGKLANLNRTQKIIVLVMFSLVFIASAAGGFFGYQDYQAGKTLKQGVAQDTQGKFDEAGDTLGKAKRAIAYPGTKKAIDKEIANNKRWKEYFGWQKQAENLINGKQYATALELLYKINSDYPLYSDVQNLIAIAEAGGNPAAVADVSVNSTPAAAGDSSTGIIPVTPSGGGGTYVRPYTPGGGSVTPPSGGGGGGTVNPPSDNSSPPIPTPTIYVYKGDGATKIGTFVGYNGGPSCTNIVYNNGSIQRQLTGSDCAVENAINLYMDWMYYPNTSCSGNSGFYPTAGLEEINVYVGMPFYYRGQIWQITSTNSSASVWSIYSNGACQGFGAAGGTTAYPATYARMPYTPANTLCGSAAPCIVK